MTNVLRDALVSMAIIVAAGLALTGVSTSLQSRIEQRRQHNAEKIYFDALSLPANEAIKLHARAVTDDKNLATELAAPTSVYLARRNDGAILGIVLSAVADGYNGAIDLLVGLGSNGTITHVRVISHRESKNIGDAIDIARSQWIENFSGKSINNIERIKLKSDGGDIDQITGATVTSRAVAKTVRAALIYFSEHREELLQAPTHE